MQGPPDETQWHKCRCPLWPRRMIDGDWLSLSSGQVWRRKNASGNWEYRQDDETREEWFDRQW